DTARSMRRLPFTFANRFKLVLETDHPERPPILYYVELLNPAALVEVRRVLKRRFVPQAIDKESFDKNLTEAYERDSSE
ncbi:type II secretion system protein GspE, partial [Vibrio parahaemolyticus]